MFPSLSAHRARQLVDSFAGRRIVVIGDVMLDQFTIGSVTRISPEAPVPVVTFARDEFRAGGAANVALNASALGARVDLIGLVGEDTAADRLRELLTAAGITSQALVTDDKRRTTTKVRIVTTRNQQVARIDYEADESVAGEIEQALVAQINGRCADADVIVVSDYLKGVVTQTVMTAVRTTAQSRGIRVLVDPKVPHLDFYAGSTLVTPNNLEAETATHRRIKTNDDAKAAAARFRERARCEGVLITRGEHGMWLSCGEVEGALPATSREVSDVTGAGDTVVATLALTLAAGGSYAEAAQLANEAAGIVVGKFGPAAVAPEELLAKFLSS